MGQTLSLAYTQTITEVVSTDKKSIPHAPHAEQEEHTQAIGKIISTDKKFALHRDNRVSLWSNSPFPDSLWQKFNQLEKPIVWDTDLGWPYLAVLYCHNYQGVNIDKICDHLGTKGWKKAQMYELETNSFTIRQQTNDRVYFGCSSTAKFSGIPTDTPGFSCDFIILQSYPGSWGFNVPSQYAEDVRRTLLAHGWTDNTGKRYITNTSH